MIVIKKTQCKFDSTNGRPLTQKRANEKKRETEEWQWALSHCKCSYVFVSLCICRPQISKCYKYFFFKCWLTSNGNRNTKKKWKTKKKNMQCNVFKCELMKDRYNWLNANPKPMSYVCSMYFLFFSSLWLWPFCSLFPMEFYPTHKHTFFFIVFAKIIANKNIFAIIEWASTNQRCLVRIAQRISWYLQVSSQHAMSTNLNQFYSSIFNWIYGIRFGYKTSEF